MVDTRSGTRAQWVREVMDVPVMTRRELGRAGEDHAARLLESAGLRILERNWRDGRRGEIDILAWDGAARCAVAVEVRTRRGDARGSAWESVTPEKFTRMRRTAAAWAARNGAGRVRLDVVALTLPPGAGPTDIASAVVRWVRGVRP